MDYRQGSIGKRRAVLFFLAALFLQLAGPLSAAAQDAPPIVPIVSDEALAVVDGEGTPIEPVNEAAPSGDEWVDPNATADWVDPAAVPAADDSGALAGVADQGWADPAAAPLEAEAEPAVPADEFPSVAPSSAPPPSVAGAAGPVADWVPPTSVYVAETGQAVSGAFLDVWRGWAAELSWGYPVTPEIQENGRTVQYFGFGRFEWAPDDPNGEVVKFGNLGGATRPFMIRRSSAPDSVAIDSVTASDQAWIPLKRAPEAESETFRWVPETGHTLRNEILALWVQTGEASYLGNPLSEPYQANGLTYQVFERGTVVQEPDGWPYLLPIGQLLATRYGLDESPAPQGELPTYAESLWTPPPAPALASNNGVQVDPNGERRVLISLSQQYLWAYQGDVALWQGYISSGREGFQTPPGSFRVLRKLESQTMEGVLGGEYYNVPDVPDVMYFTDLGHALHGTYWHNNFGTPMSHGCINLPMDVAAWMYSWAPMGMRVDIVP